MKKHFLIITIVLLFFNISAANDSYKIKFGSHFSINATPVDFTITMPNYGLSTAFEMKYLYLSTGVSSSVLTPWFVFMPTSFQYFFDIGPRIPLYTGRFFQFSIPLAFRFSYFHYIGDAGDGGSDKIRRLVLGGSITLNFDWIIHKNTGVYFFMSSFFSGKVLENSKYYYDPPDQYIDNSKQNIYIGVQIGSGISHNF